MREATGELNGTVVVVIIVAMLAAFFFSTVWPNVKNKFLNQEDCAAAVCDVGFIDSGGKAYCHEAGKKTNKFQCPYKG